MKKPKLDLQYKTVPELIQLAKRIVTMMTTNPSFPTPSPALADITLKTTALETAYEISQSGNHAKVAEVHELAGELKHQLSFLASYINNIAQGDEQIIFSSGMDVSKDPEPVGLLPVPANLHLEKGTNSGMVLARWNNVEKAKSYEVEYNQSQIIPQSQGGEQQSEGIIMGINLEQIEWQQAGVCTKAKLMITGLTPGNRILVRVVAVNTEGHGTWSDPATMVIP